MLSHCQKNYYNVSLGVITDVSNYTLWSEIFVDVT